MKHERATPVRIRRAVTFFAVGLLAFIVVGRFKEVFGSWAPEIEHAVTTLAVVALVHLLDRIWLFEDVREALSEIGGQVHKEIDDTKNTVTAHVNQLTEHVTKQVDGLTHASLSLAAMNQSGVVRMYSSRAEAYEDMYNDLIVANPSTIRLIGISLNDFVRGGIDNPLGKAWKEIARKVKESQDSNIQLAIKVLIIDPECLGAELRSKAEHKEAGALPDRLRDDINLASQELLKLTRAVDKRWKAMRKERDGRDRKEKVPRISFECRMYRVAPQLFLCHTENACYVHPYHFWRKRHNRTPIPVLRYRPITENASATAYNMHAEMCKHFDWVWRWASFPIAQMVTRHTIGVDREMYRCGAVNVFTNSGKSWERIQYLLKTAKNKVDIQGISLHSFFNTKTALQEGNTFRKLVDGGNVEIRVLLLDMNSDQAAYRSYREHLLTSKVDSTAEFTRHTLTEHMRTDHKKSHLFIDTSDSLEAIKMMVADVAKSKKQGWKPKIRLKLYSSAPVAFVLRIDKALVTEQYQYGKHAPHPKTLGQDMPIMEFGVPKDGLLKPADERSPYLLMENHFDFVWKTSVEVDLLPPTVQESDDVKQDTD